MRLSAFTKLLSSDANNKTAFATLFGSPILSDGARVADCARTLDLAVVHPESAVARSNDKAGLMAFI
jgi:hypothetical protein